MNSVDLTERELHIKSIFLPKERSLKKEYLSEEKVCEIIKSISEIGEHYGFVGDNESRNLKKASKRRHKYDVWIAKEIKKNLNLLSEPGKFRFILDWAINTKSDVFSYSFDAAYNLQEKWHKELFEKYDIEDIQIPDVDKNRIVYRCSDKKHFVYILNPEDLKYEGRIMSMCVGGDHYKSKVRNGTSIIVSLRDEKNQPHVTTEIDVKTQSIVQQYGKGNTVPLISYKLLMVEFVLFATNYEGFENGELIRLLNLGHSI